MGYSVFTGTKYYNSSLNWNNNVLYIGNHLIAAKTAISGNYVVNSNTVTIAGYAFDECVNLTGISIPGSVVCIGNRAFIGCTGLNKITLPNSLRWIGSYAFYNTGYYNNASNWDDGVLYIGNHLIEADEDISGTYLIKNGTITIADRAFDYRRGLTGVTIPNSVVTIGGGAFMECYNLSSVSIGSNVTYIGGSAFYCCYNLKTITIPNSVVTIDSYAFCGCGLVTVSMGTGVQTLGESAFEDAALVSIVLPNSLISIGDRAFNGCARLVEVINRSSINITAGSSLNGEVGYYAKEIHSGASKIVNQNGYLFYTHEGVNYLLCYIGTDTALTLPESYNGEKYSIHQYAFAGVEWLSVTISDNVTGIGNRVFAECDDLTSVTYEGTKEEWEKIQKDNEWAYRSDIETVHCSDEDITL